MKTVESIAVTPSVFVTVHVNAPQVDLRLLLLDTLSSVQLKTPAVLLTLYVKAGEANLDYKTNRVSARHGFKTTMVKSFVAKTVEYLASSTFTLIL